MTRPSTKANHLRLVEPVAPADRQHALLDPANRELIRQLGHDLVEVLIKIADLQDGDPDLEANGDEFEDADPAENDGGL